MQVHPSTMMLVWVEKVICIYGRRRRATGGRFHCTAWTSRSEFRRPLGESSLCACRSDRPSESVSLCGDMRWLAFLAYVLKPSCWDRGQFAVAVVAVAAAVSTIPQLRLSAGSWDTLAPAGQYVLRARPLHPIIRCCCKREFDSNNGCDAGGWGS